MYLQVVRSVSLLAAVGCFALPLAAQVEFNRDVRPILSERCYTCHGPDETKRLSALRFDTEAGGKADLGGRFAIVPGDVGRSEMIHRVTSDDPVRRMPPAYAGHAKLTEAEISLLTRWVKQGAAWQGRWSFVTPTRPQTPAVSDPAWLNNAIDNFVLERLDRQGLEPSPAADRRTLIRRASLDLTDLTSEPDSTFDLYGEQARRPGTFAANFLLARRLAERDVRFIQLFHRGWDQHFNLPQQIPGLAQDIDRASAGLITDLKQRGMLDDTLVVWGGEFGRTVYSQGKLTADNYVRDHHPRCFTIFMAGGDIKPGMSYGETDDYSYNVVDNPVHVHDLHATILHTLGVDHTKLTYKFQGRKFRLTDARGSVIKDVLA